MPSLRQFATLGQLNETRELQMMSGDDHNAGVSMHFSISAALFRLLIFLFVFRIFLQAARRIDAMSALTQLTPRNLDGDVNLQVARNRVLPYHINPRDGWKHSLHGEADDRVSEALNKESIVNKSVLRNRAGFKNPDLNHFIDLDCEGNFTTEPTSPLRIKPGGPKLALGIFSFHQVGFYRVLTEIFMNSNVRTGAPARQKHGFIGRPRSVRDCR